MPRVELHSFNTWCRTLDEAVKFLPEDSDWPHELYILLVEQVPLRKKRIVMWTEGDTPIGVVAFVQNVVGNWEPVTQWIVPGLIGPVASTPLGDLLVRLPFRTHIAWWRMDDSIPQGGNVREVKETPTYGMSCSTDFEAFWKQTGLLRTVRKARNRCEKLTIAINAPGAIDWVIERSENHWRVVEGQPLSWQLPLKIMVAKYLEAQGKHITLTLQDGTKFVSGEAILVHRREMVAVHAFRDRDYDDMAVGTRSLELAFQWARDNGLVGVDIGGGYDHYKKRWAPMGGSKAKLLISPTIPYAKFCVCTAMSSVWNTVTPYFGKVRRGLLGA